MSEVWLNGSLLQVQKDMLEWRVKPEPTGGALFSQLVFFAPKGVRGFRYWYVLYPIHHLVFKGLFKQIKQKAGQFQ